MDELRGLADEELHARMEALLGRLSARDRGEGLRLLAELGWRLEHSEPLWT